MSQTAQKQQRAQLPAARQGSQPAPGGNGARTPLERRDEAQGVFTEFRKQLNSATLRQMIAGNVAAHLRTTGYVDNLVEDLFTACRDNPALLLDCDRASLFRSAERVAKKGLRVGPGGCWLVPYKGQVQEQLDYRGAMTLARRSGMVKRITAQVVHENDGCELLLGSEQRVVHKPALSGGRGAPIGVYALAYVGDEDYPEIEWMSWDDVLFVQRLAPSGGSPAWKNWPTEMARKVVLKRLCKRLPLENPDALLDHDDAGSRTIDGVAEPPPLAGFDTAALVAPADEPPDDREPAADDREPAEVRADPPAPDGAPLFVDGREG